MVLDALRGYVEIASGLGDVTRQRAVATARQILEQSGEILTAAVATAGSADFAKQVQGLADDMLATSRTNRDLLVGLIRTEIERTVARLGLVGADELASMARVVERLQNQLDAAIAFSGRGSPKARPDSVFREPETFGGTPAKKAAKKSPAKKSPAKATADKAAKRTPAKKTTAKKAAKKSSAKKTTARRTTTEHTPDAPSHLPSAPGSPATGPSAVAADPPSAATAPFAPAAPPRAAAPPDHIVLPRDPAPGAPAAAPSDPVGAPETGSER
jgi:hypothetical protein